MRAIDVSKAAGGADLPRAPTSVSHCVAASGRRVPYAADEKHTEHDGRRRFAPYKQHLQSSEDRRAGAHYKLVPSQVQSVQAL